MNKKIILIMLFFIQPLMAQISPEDLIISTYPSDRMIDVPQISNNKLVITFSQNMNHESVLEGMNIEPEFPSIFWFPPKWVGNEFHYHSRQPEPPAGDEHFDYLGSPYVLLTLLPGTTYTVTLDTTVQTAAGIKLNQPYTFTFTTAEPRYDRNTIKDYVTDLYKTDYNITLTDPFIARAYESRNENGTFSDYWVSVAYLNTFPYRFFIADDGSYLRGRENEWNMIEYIPPQGRIKILNAVIDYNNSNIGDLFENQLVASQDSVNNEILGYFQSIGVTDTVYFISNTNLLINIDDLDFVQQANDPSGIDIYENVIDYAQGLGYERENYDVVMVYRMDPSDGTYYFAGIADIDRTYILLDDGVANKEYYDYEPHEFYILSYIGYYHELYHLFGWEHSMPTRSFSSFENTDPEINHLLDKPDLYVLPGLFGWEDIDGDGIVEIVDPTPYGILDYVSDIPDAEELPDNFILMQNYPNPFNPTTNIKFDIPKSVKVVINVYDILGRRVEELVNKDVAPGSYEIIFHAKNLSSGIYFYRIYAGDFVETKKMILMR